MEEVVVAVVVVAEVAVAAAVAVIDFSIYTKSITSIIFEVMLFLLQYCSSPGHRKDRDQQSECIPRSRR